MTLKAKIKTVCKNCTDATVDAYTRNVRRLHKLVGEGEVPLKAAWLNDALLNKLKKEPLKVRRHLSIAAVKFAAATDASDKKKEMFQAQMLLDANAYKKLRGEQKWSEEELKKRPSGGMKDIKKAHSEIWRRVRRQLANEKQPSLKTLYKYTAALLLRLYQELPLRNTWATLQLEDTKTNNYLQTGRGVFKVHIRQHKNSKKTGGVVLTLSRASTMALRKFLKYAPARQNILICEQPWQCTFKGRLV